MTDKCVEKLVCGRNYKLSNDQVKFATTNIKEKNIVCDFPVKRVVTFGEVLYLSQ